MSTYSSYDFEESLGSHKREEIASVVAAWGYSSEGWASWCGGFLCEMKDGTFLYITGWCDSSGWGCQDGRSEAEFATRPDLDSLKEWATPDSYGAQVPVVEWDLDPADLNRYVRGEIESMDQL